MPSLSIEYRYSMPFESNPLDVLQITEREALFELSPEQNSVYEGIKKKLQENPTTTTLLHGVTASGKTEAAFFFIFLLFFA